MEEYLCAIPSDSKIVLEPFKLNGEEVRAVKCQTGMVFAIRDNAMIDCVIQLSKQFQLQIRPSKMDGFFVIAIKEEKENTVPVWKYRNDKLDFDLDTIYKTSEY